jgi:acyl carrier protein
MRPKTKEVRQTGAVMDDVKEVIRQFVLTTYLPGESRENLRDHTPLLTSGILDSLAALGLASFVEEQFGVELDVYDTSVERFNCIQDIARSVEGKLSQRARLPGEHAA